MFFISKIKIDLYWIIFCSICLSDFVSVFLLTLIDYFTVVCFLKFLTILVVLNTVKFSQWKIEVRLLVPQPWHEAPCEYKKTTVAKRYLKLRYYSHTIYDEQWKPQTIKFHGTTNDGTFTRKKMNSLCHEPLII